MRRFHRISTILLMWGLSNAAFAQNDGRSLVHVFPQFADGRFSDGTYYRSALSFISPAGLAGTCTAKLIGATAVVQNTGGNSFTIGTLNISLGAGVGGWYLARSLGTAAFQSGYLTLNCTAPQTAQLLYSFYSANGVKLSEATVFSSPPGTSLQLTADQRDGAQLGLAIVNDTASPVTATISAFPLGSASFVAQVSIPATSHYVKFLNEVFPTFPANQVGAVTIGAGTPLSAIGLRFTGAAFTTIPSTVLVQ